MRMGTTFVGSDSVQVSVADEEILEQACYKFSLVNEEDTTVSINGSDPIFLKAGVGFSTNQVDAQIHSFKFLEDGIEYYWVGGI